MSSSNILPRLSSESFQNYFQNPYLTHSEAFYSILPVLSSESVHAFFSESIRRGTLVQRCFLRRKEFLFLLVITEEHFFSSKKSFAGIHLLVFLQEAFEKNSPGFHIFFSEISSVIPLQILSDIFQDFLYRFFHGFHQKTSL